MDEFKEFIESEVKLISAKTNPSGIAMIWKDSVTTREDIDKLMSTLPSKLITFENYMYTIHRETWQIVFKRVISSLLSSYNSTARSITNSSIDDTNSIIEIRKYLASCLLEVIFSVIALGNSMDVSYPPEYIKSLEDKYSKGIPSIVMFMHSEQPSHTQIQEKLIPEELNTPRAREYLAKAIEKGLCDSNYKWLKGKQLLSCFAREMSLELKLGTGQKSDGTDRLSWKPFEVLFGIKARKLSGGLNDLKKTGQDPSDINLVDSIFN